MKYRTVAAYSVASLVLLSSGCTNYKVGEFTISQKTIENLSDDANRIGSLIDTDHDKIITEKEIRAATSVLEKVLNVANQIQVAKQ